MGKLAMEFLQFPIIIASIFTTLLVIYYFHKPKSNNKLSPAPVAAGAWPVIGHLHHLTGSQPPHKIFSTMADKYGPIFTINLGVHRVLIVNNCEIAKECFTTNDKIISSRPKSLATEILGFNGAMFGLSPYGDYWRQVRKISILELLSNHRLETLKHVRESEVKKFMNETFVMCDKSCSGEVKVEMKKIFSDITSNIVFRMIMGKTVIIDSSRNALREFSELFGAFVVADALPFLRWLDIGGHEKAMRKTAAELDGLLQESLDEHKGRKGNDDFMDAMIYVLDGVDDFPSFDADTTIKSTCLALILAGSDTTTVTLTWALSLLLNNPHILKKAKIEIDTNVGKQKKLQESDIKNLVYLQAIIKETLRLYPAAPLSLPRESMDDCIIAGHHIPKGTRILFNLWKIQRDPRVWSDPFEFRPERFLTDSGIDFRGQNFELIPFGGGRRICPGISFAAQVLHIMLANLLHGFEISVACGDSVDMSENFGLTVLKSIPLEVLLTPCLPSHLYD